MASMKHLHSYERSKNNMEIYRCIHPQCTHFTRRELIVGKEVTCTKCHEPMIAKNEQLHAGHNQIGVKKLTCLMCGNSPKRHQIQAIEDVLSDVLNDFSLGSDEGRESA
jgi:RNase P subunit RPR2